MIKHGNRAHALLAASKSERWLNCTPSARLEEALPEPQQSVFAAEGELAHELANLQIDYLLLRNMTEAAYDAKLLTILEHELFEEDMLDYVHEYVDFCDDAIQRARAVNPDATILVETRLDLRDYVPDGFGTLDFGIVSDGWLEIVDLKYGRGVLVEADDNSQLKVYALGAYSKLNLMFDIQNVRMSVVQPRRNAITSFEMTVQDLLDWGEDELKVRAAEAYAGEGDQKPGDWCKFCKVKPQCRALAKHNQSLTRGLPDKYVLSDEEIANILEQAPLVTEWINGITSYALSEAVAGRSWPGFKLVAGRSSRKWVDPIKIAQLLEQNTDMSTDEIYTSKLNGIIAIERRLGKKQFSELLDDYIIKPPGSPTLAPLSDKRLALGHQSAQSDFSDN